MTSEFFWPRHASQLNGLTAGRLFFSGIFDWSLLSIGFDFSLSVGDAPITHRMFSCLDFASMPLSSFLRVWERTEGLNEEFFFVFLVEIELSARLSGFPLYFVSFLSRRLNLSFFVAFVLCSFSCFASIFGLQIYFSHSWTNCWRRAEIAEQWRM